tara:strand:- start:1949 stop:2737 length:789 start_codon:yes stop_codon:yes gene_type:complete
MNILFIGDIVGKPGRRALKETLGSIRKKYQIDFCVGNGENAAGGFGLTPEVANELFDLGIDVITSGNHIFDKQEIIPHLSREHRILRPANYPAENPGKGWVLARAANGQDVAVLNLIGRVYMDAVDCPFKKADSEIPRLKEKANIILVDMHAEVTSEKNALGWHLDGRVSAVLGSHTHVQTADERILPGGTAYLTDAGMTGPRNSVIGIKKETAISRFITRLPRRFETASGESQVSAAAVDIDSANGQARKIERIQLYLDVP